jgi:PIN domain nuclease of toxin-antitoxin system
MKLLLDSHVLLWWTSKPTNLSDVVLKEITSPNNTIFLSIVSVWEIQIKLGLGKLNIPEPLPQMIAKQMSDNGVQMLNISPEHVYALGSLPMHHRDPFDRLLIAQASVEGLTLVTRDAVFPDYGIPLLW